MVDLVFVFAILLVHRPNLRARRITFHYHRIGFVQRAIEMKEASRWLMERYSRISRVNLFFSFIPAPLTMVRIDLAVRPSFPITLPRSL